MSFHSDDNNPNNNGFSLKKQNNAQKSYGTAWKMSDFQIVAMIFSVFRPRYPLTRIYATSSLDFEATLRYNIGIDTGV